MKTPKNKAIIGTADYHEVMQFFAKNALSHMAGYIAPQCDEANCNDIEFTARMYRHLVYGYLLLEFEEPICAACRRKFGRVVIGNSQNSWYDGIVIMESINYGETCSGCGKVYKDDIPF